ncbi:uncharacterized protein PV09_07478 [Verruconis gallopava]|uniref:Uncharacterized protein n=1 Tax=Verruconis gallopava TaxID=253628 RepID=A0A0D1YJ97_9PEZI|nr:uncharacterized protein PV09_07478 [Verruconis gallopava]KIW00952.1 hypothetical protein PV09_07478 [Verruconis gallopava]
MLQWRSTWSICPQCRLRLLGSALNRRILPSTKATLATLESGMLRPPLRAQLISSSTRARFLATSSSRSAQETKRSGKEIEARDHSPPPIEDFDTPPELREPTRKEDEGQTDGTFPDVGDSLEPGGLRASPEEMAKAARNFFGDSLPQGALTHTEFMIYKRMYGEPSAITTDHLAKTSGEGQEDSAVLLRENEDGTVDEFEYVEEHEEIEMVGRDAERHGDKNDDLDELTDEPATLRRPLIDLEVQEALATVEDTSLTFGEIAEETGHSRSRTRDEILEEIYENWPEDDNFVRTHPFTEAGKFGTKPSTLQLPREAFVAPVQAMLSNVSNKHLIEAAHKSLGGIGIPDSPSTPAIGRNKGQRPVPLTAMQSKMSPMESNVFVSSIMPQMYASAVSVLVECRKRMGSAWLRGLIRKEGGPLVLDAGAGGAAIVAIRELLRAEWESMQEDDGKSKEPDAQGRSRAPVGKATVVTGSDSLRHKASTLLENTTFIPRLPGYIDPTETESNTQQPRKRYDIIVASHALWSLTEEHERKARTQTLWSLLNPNGGLLILIEKGVPRGFEVIASARDLLLRKHISSPGDESVAEDQRSASKETGDKKERFAVKEKGCIIAPCTNHTQCPLYPVPGVSRGRKDWCYFQQRYIRPSYLMTVLQAKARNHDDVEFSYLAVQRGVDVRTKEDDLLFGQGFEQRDSATERAKAGYGPKRSGKRGGEEAGERQSENPAAAAEEEEQETGDAAQQQQPQPHPLSLPRIVPAPLKRKGHILLDVCTPSGTYERWMVRRALGKQAFRDARKAKWGDLWALGASSTEARRVKLGTPIEVVRMATKRERERSKGWRKGREGGRGKWQYGEAAMGA